MKLQCSILKVGELIVAAYMQYGFSHYSGVFISGISKGHITATAEAVRSVALLISVFRNSIRPRPLRAVSTCRWIVPAYTDKEIHLSLTMQD